MKKSFLSLLLISGIFTSVLFSCSDTTQQKAEKVEAAKVQLQDAKQNLSQARQDSVNDYAAFKTVADAQLAANDKMIADLKVKMNSDRAAIREKYQKQLSEINAKNELLKDKMNNYKETTSDQWASFKLGFNQDMDALGKSISGLANRNMNKN